MNYELVIEDKSYMVPKRLTIRQFKELANWDIIIEDNWTKVLSIIMDIPYNEAKLIPHKTKELGIVMVIDKIFPKNSPVDTKRFVGIKDVSTGLFVDMEVALSNGVQKNVYDIIKLLYNVEPKDDEYIDEYYGGINYYLNWRLNIFNSYRKLFGLDDEFSKNDDELQEKIDPAYNWYSFIMVLADEDFLKINEVVKKPIIEALNFLAYKKDKAEKEKQRFNELQRNSRLN
jgi:hypothetical protein